jgi:hypothetical protein
MRNRFCFYIDPGHGWLAVLNADLRAFDLTAADFTACSYVSEDGQRLYLEEDCDAPKFIAAFEARLGFKPEIFERHSNSDSFIRRLPRNAAGQWKPFAR